MRNAERGEAARLDGRDLRIGIVQARFNAELTDRDRRAPASTELPRSASRRPTSPTSRVPGALEIGAALNALADADEYDALVAIGCVIRGETYHFELVANESGAGVTRVASTTACRRQRDPDLRHAGAGRGARRREGPRRGARRGRDGQPARRAVVSDTAEPAAGPPRRPRARGGQRSGDSRRRGGSKSARRTSREFALQGLYEWLLNGADAGVVDAHVREQEGFDKCDRAHFDLLLHGVHPRGGGDRRALAAHIDRTPSCSRRSSTRR